VELADLPGRFVCLSAPFAPAAGSPGTASLGTASFRSAGADAFSWDRLLSSRASLPFSVASWVLSFNISRIKLRCASMVRPCSKTSMDKMP